MASSLVVHEVATALPQRRLSAGIPGAHGPPEGTGGVLRKKLCIIETYEMYIFTLTIIDNNQLMNYIYGQHSGKNCPTAKNTRTKGGEELWH